MRIYHVASSADWAAATRAGTYTISSRGRTLEQEGFIHAAREDQVPGVLARFYADVSEPLVVLEIDTDRLDVPWREDPVEDDTFPHIYGPLTTSAVVDVRPARPDRKGDESASSRIPPPAQIAVFHGLAVVLGFTAAALLLAGALAHHQAPTSQHTEALIAAQFLLWSLTAVAFVAALAAWGVGNAYLNAHRDLTTWRAP
jgi:uncharacterized protein (DUF952 family)